MYILTIAVDNDDEDAILEGESIYLDRIQCSFQEGLPLPAEDIQTPIPFKLNEYTLRGNMTDHLSMDEIPGPVFSAKAKMLFDRIGIRNIEYYQLSIIDNFAKEGQTKESDKVATVQYADYFISNVVGLVDCINHENSMVEYFYPPELRQKDQENDLQKSDPANPFIDENPNEIDFITSLVLDESKIDPSLKIFRLKDKPDLLVFHESVVNEIRKEKLTGFVFVPVNEYTDAIPDDDDTTEQREDENAGEQQPASLPRSEPKPEPQAPPPTELKPITEPRQPLEEPAEKKKGRSRFFID